MKIQLGKNAMLDAIFRAVFDGEAFKEASSRERLRVISAAGEIAQGFLAADPEAKLEFGVSF